MNLLQGKKGIIFGALNDMSIAWKTAETVHRMGAEIVLTNAPVAMRMGEIHKLAEALRQRPRDSRRRHERRRPQGAL